VLIKINCFWYWKFCPTCTYSGIKQQSLEYLNKTYEQDCDNTKVGRCNFEYFYWSIFLKTVWPCIVIDSLWIKPTDVLSSSFIGITTLYVSESLSALHQEFLAVHRHWYNLCSLVIECYQAQDGIPIKLELRASVGFIHKELFWSVTKFEHKTSYNKLFVDIFIYHRVMQNKVQNSYTLTFPAYIRAIIRLIHYL
jgi:hypothetical protein